MIKMNKKLMAITAALLVVAAGGCYWWSTNYVEEPEVELADVVQPQKYFKIKKVVLSLPSDRYLLIEFSLKMTKYQENTSQLIEDVAPVIRNATILVMGTKPIEELIDSSYLEAHQNSIHKHITQRFADNNIDLTIDEVLITKLVVQ